MHELSRIRLALGLVLWVVLLVLGGQALLSPEGVARGPAERVLRFAGESPSRLAVAFPAEVDVRVGDPVLVADERAYLVQIGRVERVEREADATVADLVLHPERSDLLREGLTANLFTVPSSASWIVTTLLPDERRAEIRKLGEEFLARHGESIRDALWPEVRQGLLDVLAHLERELPPALAGQSARWNELGLRHRDGVLRERLVPVLQEVSLTLAREKFEPLMNEVGEELWRALPVWSLGWKAVWQSVPFTPEGQVKSRFDAYLRKDAGPILAAHADEAGRLAGEVVSESLRNPKVREAIAEVLRTISADPELAALAKGLVDDLVLKNERFGEVLRRRWESGLGDAVATAVNRFEPLVHHAINSVILDEQRTGISPRLSRVLRTRVLMKDGRWVLLTGGEGAPLADGDRIAGAVSDG